MADGFTSYGGLRIGGQSEFFNDYIPGCNLLLCEGGLIDALDVLTAAAEGHYKAGLFKNDLTPWLGMDISAIVPADFSGYVGLQHTYGWQAATIQGVRSVAQAVPLTWIHDGGPSQCWVFGYYVTNASGNLEWAERFCPAPFAVNSLGIRVRAIPRLTLRNEFPRQAV